MNALRESRFTLADVSAKIRHERIPTFVVTREPAQPWQEEAMAILEENEWIEIRYNASIHAKVFVASAQDPAESFALFGSGNLTGKSITSNLEVGMMITARGLGRSLVDELYFWAHQRLRILSESRLHQPLRRIT
jgi:phosphatidylserine/phosphatidylglycerophosphate/cardiolipin synthase-like enzyme